MMLTIERFVSGGWERVTTREGEVEAICFAQRRNSTASGGETPVMRVRDERGNVIYQTDADTTERTVVQKLLSAILAQAAMAKGDRSKIAGCSDSLHKLRLNGDITFDQYTSFMARIEALSLITDQNAADFATNTGNSLALGDLTHEDLAVLPLQLAQLLQRGAISVEVMVTMLAAAQVSIMTTEPVPSSVDCSDAKSPASDSGKAGLR